MGGSEDGKRNILWGWPLIYSVGMQRYFKVFFNPRDNDRRYRLESYLKADHFDRWTVFSTASVENE